MTARAVISDHGYLIGLSDDDHPQYLKNLIEDTTPQLGGNLDGQAFDITTTGTITGGRITISNPTPILVFKDNTYVGDDSLGYIEWRDLNNTRLGFFGNSSSGNDDLLWKNESSGGHIGIQTTGGGEVQILADAHIIKNTPELRLTSLDDSNYYGRIFRTASGRILSIANQVEKQGEAGKAAQANTNQADIVITDPAGFSTTAFTHCVWVHRHAVFAQDYGCLWYLLSATMSLFVAMRSTGNIWIFNTTTGWDDTGLNIANGETKCLQVWYDGTTLSVSLNDGTPWTQVTPISGTLTRLWLLYYAGGNSANAWIDEAQFYNSELTSAQRTEYYGAGSGIYTAVTGATPEGAWHFQDDCVDWTGNGHTGTPDANISYVTGKVNIPGSINERLGFRLRDGISPAEGYVWDLGDITNHDGHGYIWNDIELYADKKFYIRDSAIGIYSQADTFLDFFADGGMRFGNSSIGAPTNYLNISPTGVVTMAGTAKRGLTLRADLDYTLITAQGKPTQATIGVIHGYSMPIYNNDNEELFFNENVPGRWGGASDIRFHVLVALASAETAGETFKFQLSWNQVGETDIIPTTTHDVTDEVTVVDGTQYATYYLGFIIDYNVDGGDPILVHDDLAGRLRRVASSGDEVDGEIIVLDWHTHYTVDKMFQAP